MSIPLQETLLMPILTDPTQMYHLSQRHLYNYPLPHLPENNLTQNKAIQSALNQVLTLIQGPPGTGKTTTAINIVRQWRDQFPSQKILVCADSNVAVDQLYYKMKLHGIASFRLGITDVNENTYSQLRHNVHQADIICTTCVSSASIWLQKQKFPRVLIDEATQATEMNTLIPLSKDCQQLVLLGDHKQLPPTVISQTAIAKGMGISLFERLVRQGVQPILLTTQYRMHPSLILYPNLQFYNNLLINGVDEAARPIIQGFNWPNPNIRLAVLHTSGQEISQSYSLHNNHEVSAVISILKRILTNDVIGMHQIGVITPYNAQNKRLRLRVQQEIQRYPSHFGLSSYSGQQMIDIDTVDGYQGMERDLVIFSTVRSNPNRSLGFVRDPRRLNVALTRAKRGLIIVGDTNTLCHDSLLKSFLDWTKQNNCMVNYC